MAVEATGRKEAIEEGLGRVTEALTAYKWLLEDLNLFEGAAVVEAVERALHSPGMLVPEEYPDDPHCRWLAKYGGRNGES